MIGFNKLFHLIFFLPFEGILKSNGINYHKNAEEMESEAMKPIDN